jgi:hypothetical protein
MPKPIEQADAEKIDSEIQTAIDASSVNYGLLDACGCACERAAPRLRSCG